MAEDVYLSEGKLVTDDGPIYQLPIQHPHIAVPPEWGAQWRTARAEAGGRLVKVHVWGDSNWAQGNGVTPDTVANRRNIGASGLVKTALQARYGNGGAGFSSHEQATQTGTWTISAENTFAGCGARATAAASLAWADVQGTTIQMFHRNAGVTGTFRWRIDGGDWTEVTPPTGFGVEPGVVEITGLSDTAHTVDIEWVSGTVVVMGVRGLRSTGVIVERLGQNGRAASHFSPIFFERTTMSFTSGTTAFTVAAGGIFKTGYVGKYVDASHVTNDTTIATITSQTAANLSAVATGTGAVAGTVQHHRDTWTSTSTTDPGFSTGLGRADLVIVALGTNDPVDNVFDGRTVSDGLSRILNQYLIGTSYSYSPDFVFCLPHFASWFDLNSRKSEVLAAIVGVARGVGAAIYDQYAHSKRSYKFWNDLGYFTDTVHFSTAGHATVAQPVINLLTA